MVKFTYKSGFLLIGGMLMFLRQTKNKKSGRIYPLFMATVTRLVRNLEPKPLNLLDTSMSWKKSARIPLLQSLSIVKILAMLH